METRRSRALRMRPMLAAVMPFPSEEVTPPVTKTYFAMGSDPPGVFLMLSERAPGGKTTGRVSVWPRGPRNRATRQAQAHAGGQCDQRAASGEEGSETGRPREVHRLVGEDIHADDEYGDCHEHQECEQRGWCVPNRQPLRRMASMP